MSRRWVELQRAEAKSWGVEVWYTWRNPDSRSSHTYEHLVRSGANGADERALCGADMAGAEPSHELVSTFIINSQGKARYGHCKRCVKTVFFKQLVATHAERLAKITTDEAERVALLKSQQAQAAEDSRRRYEERALQVKREQLQLELFPELLRLARQLKLNHCALSNLIEQYERRADDIEGGGEGRAS